MNKYIADKQTVILEEEEESGDNSERLQMTTTQKMPVDTPIQPETIAIDLKFSPLPIQSESETEIPQKESPSPALLIKATGGKGKKKNALMNIKPQDLNTFFHKICWEMQHLDWDKEREARNPKLFRVPRKTTTTEFNRTVFQEFKDWCISNLNLDMKADPAYLQWFVSNINDQAQIIQALASKDVRSAAKLPLTSQLVDLLLHDKHLYDQKIISSTQISASDPKWAAKIQEKISQFFNLTRFEFILSELEEFLLQIDKALLEMVLVDPLVNTRGQPISNRDHFGIR
jgi:hypothetical protein